MLALSAATKISVATGDVDLRTSFEVPSRLGDRCEAVAPFSVVSGDDMNSALSEMPDALTGALMGLGIACRNR
jgi:hypothetical protein